MNVREFELPEWEGPDSKLCRFVVEESRKRLEGYRLNSGDIAEHAAIEQSIVDGGYGHRQMFELIQNAADAIRESGVHGGIEVHLTGTHLYCANEGLPLDQGGANSILHSHVSAKRSHEIGHFGLGFKSVLGISRQVDVFTRPGSFRFDSDKSRLQICSAIPGYDGKTPGLRIAEPIRVDAEFESDPLLDSLGKWASTVIRLSCDLPRSSELHRDIESFPSEFLLFSPHVVRLKLIDHVSEQQRIIELVSGNDGEILLDDSRGDISRWRVFRDIHRMSDAAKNDAGEATARDEVEIAWAVPLDRRVGRGQYWAFFPTTYESSLTGILNAPWKTNSDRQGLLEGLYNTEIIDAASKLIATSVVSLFQADDPGAHLDLLPARPEDAEGWANRELTQRVYQQAAGERIIPDSEGNLMLSSSVRLLPVQAGDSSLELWRSLEKRPEHWGHERVNTRERRPRSLRLGAASSSVVEWLEAIAEPATPQSSIEAIRAVEGCSPDTQTHGRTEIAGRRARIVLSANDVLMPPDPEVLFFSGSDDVVLASISLVHAALDSSEEAHRILTGHFGLKQVDPVRELEVLLAECDQAGFERWEGVWTAIRRTELADATSLLGRHRHHLRVRTLEGGWKLPWEVLLPGPVVPSDGTRDISLTVDTGFHSRDGDVLHLLRVVAEPVARGLTSQELAEHQYVTGSWQQKYHKQSIEAFQVAAQAATGSAPQWTYIEPSVIASAGPLSPYFALSETGREIFAERLLSLASNDEMWTWHHETRRDFYPDLRLASPAQWLIRNFARLPTSLGPRALSMCVGRNLERWGAFLPIAKFDSDFLELPQTLSLISGQLIREAWKLALDSEQLSDTANFYAAMAAAGHSPPAMVTATKLSVVVRVAPAEVVVTHDSSTAAVVQDEMPILLVSRESDALVLRTRWGMRPPEAVVETSVTFEPGRPASPVVDVFPGLPAEILSRLNGIELVPCETIWNETRTTSGSRRSEIDAFFLQLEREFLFRDGLTDEELLKRLVKSCDLYLSDDILEETLHFNRERVLSRRIAEITALPTLEQKLGRMLDESELRRLLPQEILEDSGVVQEQVGPEGLAAMLLAINGSATLIRCRDELERAGFNPPRRWAGSDPALRFVREVGFPDDFAGMPARTRAPFIEVDGPLVLRDLHDFQEKIAASIASFLQETPPGRGLVSLPTGAGKTRLVTESLVRAYRSNVLTGCVLWLADRDELCEQAVQSWREVWRALGPEDPLRISRLWGDTNDRVEDVRQRNHVVVATFQSLLHRIELTRFNWLTEAACVVIDEAHGSVTASYTRILQELELTARTTGRPLIGLTATPFRGRESAEGSETERLVRRYEGRRFDHGIFEDDDPYPELRKMGVLSNADFEILEGTSFELSAPEFEQFQQFDRLPANVEARLGRDQDRNNRIVDRITSLPRDWPILVFAASIDHAELLAALLSIRGTRARAISSRTDAGGRRRAIEEFRAGEIQVLTNYGILTTGFDAPQTRGLFVARPIYSPGLYMQVIGRGLRGPSNRGTESCLIVNVEDNLLQYGSELAFRQFEHLWQRTPGKYY